MKQPMAEIYFGATCAPLREQLAGYELGSLCLPHAQADADAITRLYVRGYITQAVKDAAQKRLVGEMKRAMKTPPTPAPQDKDASTHGTNKETP